MRYELPGQENVDLAFGGVGDKTLRVTPIASTHVRLKNYDPLQPVMYTLTDPPAVGTVWQSLGPKAEVLVFLNGATKVYLRKKRWIRGFPLGAFKADGSSIDYPADVTAAIEVEEVDMS